MKPARLLALALALSIGIVAAACGGSDSGSNTAASSAAATSTSMPAEPVNITLSYDWPTVESYIAASKFVNTTSPFAKAWMVDTASGASTRVSPRIIDCPTKVMVRVMDQVLYGVDAELRDVASINCQNQRDTHKRSILWSHRTQGVGKFMVVATAEKIKSHINSTTST